MIQFFLRTTQEIAHNCFGVGLINFIPQKATSHIQNLHRIYEIFSNSSSFMAENNNSLKIRPFVRRFAEFSTNNQSIVDKDFEITKVEASANIVDRWFKISGKPLLPYAGVNFIQYDITCFPNGSWYFELDIQNASAHSRTINFYYQVRSIHDVSNTICKIGPDCAWPTCSWTVLKNSPQHTPTRSKIFLCDQVRNNFDKISADFLKPKEQRIYGGYVRIEVIKAND